MIRLKIQLKRCVSQWKKKNDFPLYISNIHTCTISFIIYTPSNSECNKFLPPLHFLYIVDNMKDRCDPRSFTVVIFGRQEKKKKNRDTFYSRFSNGSPYLEWILASRRVRFARECRHRERYRLFLLLLSWAINIIVFVIVSSWKPRDFALGRYAAKFSEEELNRFENKQRKRKRERDGKEKKNKRKSERNFTEHFFKSFLLYEFLKNQFKHVRISKNYNYNYRKIKRVSSYVVVCTPCRSSDVEVRWYT